VKSVKIGKQERLHLSVFIVFISALNHFVERAFDDGVFWFWFSIFILMEYVTSAYLKKHGSLVSEIYCFSLHTFVFQFVP